MDVQKGQRVQPDDIVGMVGMTGIAIGRGTNFLYDLWKKLKEWQSGKLLEATDGFALLDGNDVDLEITHWSLAQLKDFCTLNGVNATGWGLLKPFLAKPSSDT